MICIVANWLLVETTRDTLRPVVGPWITSLFQVLPQSLKSLWITILRAMITTCVYVADHLALFRSSHFEAECEAETLTLFQARVLINSPASGESSTLNVGFLASCIK